MHIQFSSAGSYIRVTCEGIWDPIEVTSFLQQIKENTTLHQKNLVFVDWTGVTNPASDRGYKIFAGEDVARILPPPLKIAVLDRKLRINKIAEKTARSHGANIFVSHQEEQLLAWLRTE